MPASSPARAELPGDSPYHRRRRDFRRCIRTLGQNDLGSPGKLPKDTDKLVIGPAGENTRCCIPAFSAENGLPAGGGVGAVFGDKNLKAVTVKGTKCVRSHPGKLNHFNKKWTKTLKTHPLTGRQLPKLGTAGLVAPMQAHGILATKNFLRRTI